MATGTGQDPARPAASSGSGRQAGTRAEASGGRGDGGPRVQLQYTVGSGDTLTGIALSALGNADRYTEIDQLLPNGRVEPTADPRDIQPNSTLVLPPGAAGPGVRSVAVSSSSGPGAGTSSHGGGAGAGGGGQVTVALQAGPGGSRYAHDLFNTPDSRYLAGELAAQGLQSVSPDPDSGPQGPDVHTVPLSQQAIGAFLDAATQGTDVAEPVRLLDGSIPPGKPVQYVSLQQARDDYLTGWDNAFNRYSQFGWPATGAWRAGRFCRLLSASPEDRRPESAMRPGPHPRWARAAPAMGGSRHHRGITGPVTGPVMGSAWGGLSAAHHLSAIAVR